MENKINLSEKLLRQIFQQESSRIVGTCLKRFEIHSNSEDQKKAIKEALYENLRVLQDMIIAYGKEAINLEKGKD
jgi:hypothetical protein